MDPGLTIEQLKYPDMCMHWETWLHWSTMGILLKHMTLMGGSARRPRGTTVHLWYSLPFFFFFCHSPQHYMSDLTYFILFTSGNFSDAAEEFIFSQIWTSDLLFVRPACKPLIHCVCGIVVLLLCILIDLVRSALLPRKKKMIIKQSGKHLRPGLKYRTAPLLLWTFSS